MHPGLQDMPCTPSLKTAALQHCSTHIRMHQAPDSPTTDKASACPLPDHSPRPSCPRPCPALPP